ncbi:MAG: hypothetical protein RR444_02375 [Oscillospiraceae bacterium]
MEKNYDFRKQLLTVHKTDVRDDSVWKNCSGTIVDEDWKIIISNQAREVLINAAYDLADYFSVSHHITVSINIVDQIELAQLDRSKKIILDDSLIKTNKDVSKSYRIVVDDGMLVSGSDERAAAQGCYRLEDEFNLNRGPIITVQDNTHDILFSPRMVHSGYALDCFPDEYLRSIAHQGMDAILVFTTALNKTADGSELDFNDLINRAMHFGIDVYAYIFFRSLKHPDDEGALEYYESTYGELFSQCPDLKGVVLVGESMEFPSHDPHVVWYENGEPIVPNPDNKPMPGWYPCYDYPDWVNIVKKVIRSKKPDADLVFWTYNWGYVEEEKRLELIRNLPTDISLMATFEMFERFQISDTVSEHTADYTLCFDGPGKYFASEAKEAKKRGMKLYTISNTGGLTWDVGDIPYEPCPFQWKRRYEALLKAREDWGLSGLAECHHYGFTPSFISELSKFAFTSNNGEIDKQIEAIAVRDFGKENSEQVISAWQYYSDGIRQYVATNEDQYGPFRIGPSYPLLFIEKTVIPSKPEAMFGGNKICHPMYMYDISRIDKLNYEIETFTKMLDKFKKGNEILEKVLAKVDERNYDTAKRMLGLGRFIEYATQTTIHVKQFYILKCQLLQINKSSWQIHSSGADLVMPTDCNDKERELVRKMIVIAKVEIENAKKTIPLVEFDSRLGYEPTMDYMCDKEHLLWKIEVTQRMIDKELMSLLM